MFRLQLASSNRLFLLVGSAAPTGSFPIFPAVISLIVLAAALWVILSQRYTAKVEHWAYGIVGMVLGFWLRQA